MRVFVAGATGAVGRLLVPMLVAAGHEVTGISRTRAGTERIRDLGATGVQVDALDAEALRNALRAAAPDAVIHQLTYLSGADGAANGRIRREGTRNLVAAADVGPVAGRQGWERGALNALARGRGWRPGRPTWRTGFAAQCDTL